MTQRFVLLVDDEAGPLEALTDYLRVQPETWDVTAASSAVEAVEILTSTSSPRFDVVVTDLRMEDRQSGVAVLDKALEVDATTMVIVVTAFDDDLERYAVFERGAFDCLSKNTPNVVVAQEIGVKVRAALRVRALIEEQREQAATISALGRHLDPGIVEALRAEPQSLSLRPRRLTVVFWDIRGFSYVADQLRSTPQLLTDFLQEYFEIAAVCVQDHGGILDKFIGDGVMALFGALDDLDSDADAVRAVKAALQLSERFPDLASKWGRKWARENPTELPINLGCGMHTGDAVVGLAGTTSRDQFTALGSTVNMAARLEGYAKAGEVLLSQTTKARVEKEIEVRDWKTVGDIKNILGDFRVYEAVSVR